MAKVQMFKTAIIIASLLTSTVAFAQASGRPNRDDTFALRRMLWLNAQHHEGHGEVTCFPRECARLARKFNLVFHADTGEVTDGEVR